MTYHLLCYSTAWNEHTGTTQENLDDDLFSRLYKFFGVQINKVIVVETRKTIYNKPVYIQKELF